MKSPDRWPRQAQDPNDDCPRRRVYLQMETSGRLLQILKHCVVAFVCLHRIARRAAADERLYGFLLNRAA